MAVKGLLEAALKKGFKVDSPAAVGLLSGAGALAALAPQEAEAGAAGLLNKIKAYHGSPHDFDEFSTEAIGTGEGAQAYGHGLYFAEREGTAKSYRDALTEPRFTFDGKPADAIYTNEIRERWADVYDELTDDELVQDWKLNYLDSVAENGGDYDKASEALDSLVEKTLKGEETTYDFSRLDEFKSDVDPNGVYDLNEPQRHLDAVLSNMSQADSPSTMDIVLSGLSPDELKIYERYVEPKVEYIKPEGKMYQVDLNASPDELLDYDADLIDQSQKVKDGILKLGLTDLDGKKYSIQELDDLGHRGQTLYEKISGNAGADVASMRLKDVGIKGIKYADAQTRFSPKGRTSNYVIFDDATVDIARKYGVSMPVAAGLLSGGLGTEQAQAAEYNAAPVVQEQSFGDMVNEYAQINQRAQAAEAQKFDALMREDARLRDMGSAAFGQVSPELAAYRRSQMLPTIGEIGMGALEGAVDTVDFVSQLPTAISTMTMPKRTPLRDRLGGLLDYSFVDERDQRARDQARLIGGLLSPI